MHVLLFAFGLLATAAGAAMLGFGISIKEFSLGNTLLTTGTVAVVGGLILLGLATAVQQLRRIAEALAAQPHSHPARPLEPFTSPVPAGSRASPAPSRIPFPVKADAETRGRAPAPLEPRLAAAPSIDASKEGAFDGPRIPFPPRVAAPEPHADETPLSPETAREPDLTEAILQSRAPEAIAPTRDSAADPASRDESDVLSVARLDLSFRPAPPSDAGTQNEFFDSLWPAAVRKPDAAAPEAPAPRQEAESAAEAKQAEPAEDAQAVTILKSGIIDEMAYTLYSDGSIEAEMPQGTMRFSSIAALRGYLEKSS